MDKILSDFPVEYKKTNELLLNYFLEDKLVVSTSSYIHLIAFNSILYLKAEGNYTKIVLKNRNAVLVSKTLGHFEVLLLPKSFIRVHASYLLNLDQLKQIKKNGDFKIILDSEHEIPISRKYKENFLNIILEKKV